MVSSAKPFRAEDPAELTTPSARKKVALQAFDLIAHPPLLCEEGNIGSLNLGSLPECDGLGKIWFGISQDFKNRFTILCGKVIEILSAIFSL